LVKETLKPSSLLNPNWVEGFITLAEGINSPQIYKKWAALSTIGAALERKVWVKVKRFPPLYPNLYTLILGASAVGKTNAIVLAGRLFDELKDHHLTPMSVTRAALADVLNEADRRIMRPGENPPLVHFNAIYLRSNELATFLSGYDADFMGLITDLYDNHGYSERRRNSNITPINVKHPMINLIAATTPKQLSGILPEGAWQQGFMSRMVLVYSAEQRTNTPLIEEATIEDDALMRSLISDLKQIADLYGKMTFTAEARAFINNWWVGGGQPAPVHPRLESYCGRRDLHLLKLAQIAACACGSHPIIQLEHAEMALEWLIEVEHYMPGLFKALAAANEDVLAETAYFVNEAYLRNNKKPIAEAKIVRFLQMKVPFERVMKVIEIMTKAGLLAQSGEPGKYRYAPITTGVPK